VFAVEHKNNTDHTVVGIEITPDRLHFLADLFRVSNNASLTITEIDHPTLDRHPAYTTFTTTPDTITVTYAHNNNQQDTYSTHNFGIVTPTTD